ncbi:hypothetical protein [Solwaraspora sp. WMMD792]|uniref:hypothetical protein n=1 Tax=Solwaraspora sp. WMMD792 TaxID=3016099 RepID=UPI0024176B06|nr:hypothetical protein [Solwaraspora sp. WMMD792]MDG4770937.1 hypothetical protein [Solwaraspora sp. WMMD792]
MVPRRPGSVPIAVGGVLAAVLVGLVAFLAAQGLDRADQWAGVLAMFLGVAALTVQVWGLWSSTRWPAGAAVDAAAPTDAPAPVAEPAARRSVRLPVILSALLVAAAVGVTASALRDTNSTVNGAPGWVEVGNGSGVVLGDHQSIDLNSGQVGGEHLPGGDLFLSQRSDRVTALDGGELAVLDVTGEHTVRRCLDAAAQAWDGMINGLYGLPVGTDICFTDGRTTAAMITVEHPPDVLARTLSFSYTCWELRDPDAGAAPAG